MARWLSVGIDGGLHGAVVAINDSLEVVGVFDTPIINLGKKLKSGKEGVNNAFLERDMAEHLRVLIDPQLGFEFDHVSVILEKAHSMPKQGVVSTFKTGEGFGIWKGILAALRCSYEIVDTKTWQTRVMTGVTGLDPKTKSVTRCRRLFPKLPLSREGRKAILDGRSDAALIAYYGLLDLGKIQEQRPKRTAFRLQGK